MRLRSLSCIESRANLQPETAPVSTEPAYARSFSASSASRLHAASSCETRAPACDRPQCQAQVPGTVPQLLGLVDMEGHGGCHWLVCFAVTWEPKGRAWGPTLDDCVDCDHPACQRRLGAVAQVVGVSPPAQRRAGQPVRVAEQHVQQKQPACMW